MNKILGFILLLASASGFAEQSFKFKPGLINPNADESLNSFQNSAVYCDRYQDQNRNRWGYSLYRSLDNVDLANAYFLESNFNECSQAAQAANYMSANIVCARFYNSSTQSTHYSIYRISDGKDLGNKTFSTMESCNNAVYESRGGIFCAPFAPNNRASGRWSMYEVWSGKDIGTQHYNSFERCIQNY